MNGQTLNFKMQTNDMKQSTGSTLQAHDEISPGAHSLLGTIMQICAAPKLHFPTPLKTDMKNRRGQLGVRLLTLVLPLLVLMGTHNAQAAIAQRGTATTATTTTTTLTINKPTGVVAGDVLIASFSSSANNNAVASLSGWTSIAGANLGGGSAYGTVLWKVAGGSEPTSYAFSVGGVGTVGAIVAFTGVDTSGATPFDATGTLATGSSTSVSATSITTVSANAAIIIFGMEGSKTAGNVAGTWSCWTTDRKSVV